MWCKESGQTHTSDLPTTLIFQLQKKDSIVLLSDPGKAT